MDNSDNKQYGVQRKTIKAMDGLKSVLESATVISQLKALVNEELAQTMTRILDLPDDHPNWEHNIAVLIGQARTHRSYSELYTIKEK